MYRNLIFLTLTILSSLATANDFQISSKHLFKKSLEARKASLSQWAEKLNSESYDFLCFGETHNSYFRDFLSTQILTQVDANILAIEGRPEKAEALMSEALLEPLPVAGENFSEVASAFLLRNPGRPIVGIENLKHQKAAITFSQIDQLNGNLVDKEPSRDSFIASNADTYLQTETKIFSVYGANHCSYYSNGLGRDTPFVRLLKNKYGDAKKIITVHTLRPEEQELIKIYLIEFGLFESDKDFVLFDVKSIDPEVYNYRLDLYKILQAYDVLIFPAD